MYAGIIVDTRNFTFVNRIRTFDAASYLRAHDRITINATFLEKRLMGFFMDLN